MPTIKDVARLANVSIATVSRVVNEDGVVSPELEKRVREAISELGYRRNAMARHLRRSQSLTLGVLIPDSSNPYFAELTKGVEDYCFSKGYTVVVCNTAENAHKTEAYITTLAEHRIAGFILVSTADVNGQLLGLVGEGYPIVLADRPQPDLDVDSVTSDNYAGGAQAIHHLVQLGHRRIGIVAGFSPLRTVQARRAGAMEALREAGITPQEELIYEGGDYLPGSGYESARTLLSLAEPPTAIFAFNDLMAFGILNYAQEHGIQVPEQLSVVGFDDIAMASYAVPSLTTIAQPKYELGKKVAEVLLKRINGDKSPHVALELPTTLVVRKSTARVANSE